MKGNCPGKKGQKRKKISFNKQNCCLIFQYGPELSRMLVKKVYKAYENK
jgi:hypothetical protein